MNEICLIKHNTYHSKSYLEKIASKLTYLLYFVLAQGFILLALAGEAYFLNYDLSILQEKLRALHKNNPEQKSLLSQKLILIKTLKRIQTQHQQSMKIIDILSSTLTGKETLKINSLSLSNGRLELTYQATQPLLDKEIKNNLKNSGKFKQIVSNQNTHTQNKESEFFISAEYEQEHDSP